MDDIEEIASMISDDITVNGGVLSNPSIKIKATMSPEAVKDLKLVHGIEMKTFSSGGVILTEDENWAEVMAEVDKLGEDLPKPVLPDVRFRRYKSLNEDMNDYTKSYPYPEPPTKKKPIIMNMRKPRPAPPPPPFSFPDDLGVRKLDL